MSSRVIRKLHGDKDIGLGIPGAPLPADGDSDGAEDSSVTFTGGTRKKTNINPFDLVCTRTCELMLLTSFSTSYICDGERRSYNLVHNLSSHLVPTSYQFSSPCSTGSFVFCAVVHNFAKVLGSRTCRTFIIVLTPNLLLFSLCSTFICDKPNQLIDGLSVLLCFNVHFYIS